MSIRLKGTPTKPRGPKRPRDPATQALYAVRAAVARDLTLLDPSGDGVDLFAQALGGRQRLIDTLMLGDTQGQLAQVVADLANPAYQRQTLRQICARSGITVATLFAGYKRASFTRAHLEAAQRITEHLVEVVEDVMRRAIPQPLACTQCRDVPRDPALGPCPFCQGTGIGSYTEPPLDRQKLALELGHLIERHAGVVMQQNTIATGGTTAVAPTAPGSLEQLQQVVGDLLFTPGRRRLASPPIDAQASAPAPEETATP